MSWINGSFIYILLCFVAAVTAIYFFKKRKIVWVLDMIPGPKNIPIIGNVGEFNVKPIKLLERMSDFCNKYGSGSIVRFWMFQTPGVIVYKASAAEVILGSSKHIEKSYDYEFFKPWLGTGLVTASYNKWHSRRKMLTQAFHFKILEDFIEIFNQKSLILIENLSSKADGESFDVSKLISLCTLDIILETAMGTSLNVQQSSEDSEYVKAISRITSLITYRQFRPWLHPNIIYKMLGYAKIQEETLKVLHRFTRETVRERKQEFNSTKDLRTNKKRLAFLDLLLNYSNETENMEDEDLCEEVDTFMFAGQDTTATAINWAIYLLGLNPEIQKKVHEELDLIFEDRNQPITMEDMKKMKFLECCMKEALRIFPSAPWIARELCEDAIIDGYTVPAGVTITIFIHKIHRDPQYFPDPEKFQPERFLSENTVGRHPFAYIPFSAGPRNCIGQKFANMEEKIILANFFRHFRVESTVKKDDLELLADMILRSNGGNFIRIFPRSS